MISLYDQETATQMYGRSQFAEGVEKGRGSLLNELLTKGLITKEQADELSKNSFTK